MLGRFLVCFVIWLSWASSGAMCGARASTYYGTTEYGGAYGYGSVFKADGRQRTLLYSFCQLGEGYCDDGAHPIGNVVLLPDGSLVGTTTEGGNGAGTIFQLRFNNAEGWRPRIIWNVCWTFWQCDSYGTSRGTLSLMGTDKDGAFILEGVCESDSGRGVLYRLTLGKTTSRIVPIKYWKQWP